MLGNPKQSWILDSTPWIPDSQVLDSGFFVSANWIPDPNRCWIPESLSCIPDSSAQDLEFHSKNLLDSAIRILLRGAGKWHALVFTRFDY